MNTASQPMVQMNIQPKEQECLVLDGVRMTIMKRMYKCSLSNVRVWIDHGSENYGISSRLQRRLTEE